LHPSPNFVKNPTRPNVRATVAGALYRTNSAGFRGREFSRVKPKETFRIIVLGDFVTMGWGVAEHDTFTARLEISLNSGRPQQHYEVLNFGLLGATSYMSWERFRHQSLRFDPDMVIYAYNVNDIEGRYYCKSFDSTVAAPKSVLNSPFYLLRILAPRPSRFVGRKEASLWVSPYDDHPNAAGRELLADALHSGLTAPPESCWDRNKKSIGG
jgi:lysophospholipase L1-like esterase